MEGIQGPPPPPRPGPGDLLGASNQGMPSPSARVSVLLSEPSV